MESSKKDEEELLRRVLGTKYVLWWESHHNYTDWLCAIGA
jgi:hypothetical protein